MLSTPLHVTEGNTDCVKMTAKQGALISSLSLQGTLKASAEEPLRTVHSVYIFSTATQARPLARYQAQAPKITRNLSWDF